MQLGNVRLHLIPGGSYWVDGGCLFGLVPKLLWQRVSPPDEHNRLSCQAWCLLIEAGSHRILVGTGSAYEPSASVDGHENPASQGSLLSGLAALGVDPARVDLVVNTHLHRAHCGGNTTWAEEVGPVATFSGATYCIQRLELADATHPNERTRDDYCQENFVPLVRAGQVQPLWGDTKLTEQVRVVVARGHTRAHQCVVVESQGQKAIYLGAVAPWPVHMERLAWLPAYDLEPMHSIETKRRLARWAAQERVLLLFESHPEIVGGYLHATERPDRFQLEPVDLLDSA